MPSSHLLWANILSSCQGHHEVPDTSQLPAPRNRLLGPKSLSRNERCEPHMCNQYERLNVLDTLELTKLQNHNYSRVHPRIPRKWTPAVPKLTAAFYFKPSFGVHTPALSKEANSCQGTHGHSTVFGLTSATAVTLNTATLAGSTTPCRHQRPPTACGTAP